MISDEVGAPGYIPHYLWKLLIDERHQRPSALGVVYADDDAATGAATALWLDEDDFAATLEYGAERRMPACEPDRLCRRGCVVRRHQTYAYPSAAMSRVSASVYVHGSITASEPASGGF